ncbi:MAG TPA: hypothetical protein VEI46_11805, partial [Thermodesulfovibrionales bacterium]|nr:hypothetical protein [Thermodesulfovibrionales bacterium]
SSYPDLPSLNYQMLDIFRTSRPWRDSTRRYCHFLINDRAARGSQLILLIAMIEYRLIAGG